MALMAPVKDGQIVETESQSSLKKANSANSSGMDKEAFLQLLVAQMKYQDPLEPTSNTEYISQYAQFSQVEQMQNMAATTELSRASALVGKEVFVKTTTSAGDVKEIQGKVDYVAFENGKAFVAINEKLYSLDDLDTVVDSEYMAAYNKAYNFTAKLNKLPNVNGIDMSDAEDIDELEKEFNEMSDYEKSFIAEDTQKRLQSYIERLKEVRLAAEQAAKNEAENNGSEETPGTEEAGGAEGTGETGGTGAEETGSGQA